MAAVKSFLNLKIIFGALIALVLVGVVGFLFIEGWSWFDGFYMVLTTITTIGYGEVHPLSFQGRIFNCFLIFFGVGIMLQVVTLVAQAVIEREFGELLGRRKNIGKIHKMPEIMYAPTRYKIIFFSHVHFPHQ